MDISMVLNSGKEDFSSKEQQHDEKTNLQPVEGYSLPPMRTQLSASTNSHDPTQGNERAFNHLNSFGMANGARYYSQGAGARGHYDHYSATPSGYQQLSSHNATTYESRPAVRLPPIETFDLGYERPKRDSWSGSSGSRFKLENVLLNPKKSVRRTSLSPTMSSRGHSHFLPSHPYSPPSHSQSLPLRSPRHSRGSVGGKHSPRLSRAQDNREAGPSSSASSDDLYVAEGEYDESSTASRNAACNKPYNPAQVDWIRYSKVDLGLSYKAMGEQFAKMWPGESKTEHCFSARFYRDNYVPRVGADGRVERDDKGEPIMEPAKMRDTKTAAGKERCVPYSLVERYPWRALEYPWVSRKSKELAQQIMDGKDQKDPTGGKYCVHLFCSVLLALDDRG
jgi:hypothetical protein